MAITHDQQCGKKKVYIYIYVYTVMDRISISGMVIHMFFLEFIGLMDYSWITKGLPEDNILLIWDYNDVL